MKKSRMWTLAMALAAALGGTMDPDLEESVGFSQAQDQGLDARRPANDKDGGVRIKTPEPDPRP